MFFLAFAVFSYIHFHFEQTSFIFQGKRHTSQTKETNDKINNVKRETFVINKVRTTRRKENLKRNKEKF